MWGWHQQPPASPTPQRPHPRPAGQETQTLPSARLLAPRGRPAGMQRGPSTHLGEGRHSHAVGPLLEGASCLGGEGAGGCAVVGGRDGQVVLVQEVAGAAALALLEAAGCKAQGGQEAHSPAPGEPSMWPRCLHMAQAHWALPGCPQGLAAATLTQWAFPAGLPASEDKQECGPTTAGQLKAAHKARPCPTAQGTWGPGQPRGPTPPTSGSGVQWGL